MVRSSKATFTYSKRLNERSQNSCFFVDVVVVAAFPLNRNILGFCSILLLIFSFSLYYFTLFLSLSCFLYYLFSFSLLFYSFSLFFPNFHLFTVVLSVSHRELFLISSVFIPLLLVMPWVTWDFIDFFALFLLLVCVSYIYCGTLSLFFFLIFIKHFLHILILWNS